MIEFLTADTSSTASLLVTFLPMVLILVFMYIIPLVVLLAALLLSMIRMIPLFWKPPATV